MSGIWGKGQLAHTDFPGLSPAHIALIESAGTLSLVGTALLKRAGVSWLVTFVGGGGGLFEGYTWAENVGQPSISQLQIDFWGVFAVVYLDKYASRPGMKEFVKTYGLNVFFGTYEIYNRQTERFESDALSAVEASALSQVMAIFLDRALPLPVDFRRQVASNC